MWAIERLLFRRTSARSVKNDCQNKNVWYIAAPAILTSIFQYSLAFLTQTLVGHIVILQLAAFGIQNLVVSGLGFGIMLGMGSALGAVINSEQEVRKKLLRYKPPTSALKLDMGLLGAALTLNLSWWLMVLGQLAYILLGSFKESWTGFSWLAFADLSGFVTLFLQLKFHFAAWVFTVLIILVGLLKNPEIQVDAASIWYVLN
ncbi:hypothetical protein GIB67_023005 [Kingdonia uniflora]|uniref:Uncharacterized protein n=1 Tax=Kingdonia uniflora TaxID=39325 RepID=A0A7J7P2G5_9MAGN|nr:hypothetical protein GIB67_023005 [Kingdonia uniflora]